jgi:predicted nucleotidyltransferase
MLSQKQTDDLVTRIVHAAKPNRIILFGSAADTNVSSPRDIDVLVIVENGIHRRQTAQRIYRGLLGFGLPVDVVVATESDVDLYRDSPGLVYREALSKGKDLYAA